MGLTLVAVVVFRGPVIDRIKAGSSLQLGPFGLGELRAKIDTYERRVEDLDRKISELFLSSMDGYMYENLAKVATGHFGVYAMNDGLARELRHLRDIGYVSVRDNSVGSIPTSGADLSGYVSITPLGEQFIALREAMSSR